VPHPACQGKLDGAVRRGDHRRPHGRRPNGDEMTAPLPAGTRFEHELREPVPDTMAGPELLPARMARAVARALPVDGAGLSLHDPGGLRTPLGASDATAGHAERLQFTFGGGPCLRAHDDGTTIAFDEAMIIRNWPQLHESLVGGTPFRAVLSVPLLPPLGPLVVLDLYLGDREAMLRLDRDDVEDVVVALTRMFVGVMRDPAERADEGNWWSGPDARRRTQVWQAMGMTSLGLHLEAGDALALLKAHAFAAGRVVDDVAADLVAGRITTEELGDPPGPVAG